MHGQIHKSTVGELFVNDNIVTALSTQVGSAYIAGAPKPHLNIDEL